MGIRQRISALFGRSQKPVETTAVSTARTEQHGSAFLMRLSVSYISLHVLITASRSRSA